MVRTQGKSKSARSKSTGGMTRNEDLTVAKCTLKGRQPRWMDMDEHSYRGGVHEVCFFRTAPQATEIAAVETGTIEFSFVADLHVGFLLYRCVPGLQWAYAPVSWWLLHEAERVLPTSLSCGEAASLSIILVDSKNGEVCARRTVHLESRFSDVLHTCIREQATRRFDAAAVQKRLQRAREQYRIPETMLERAMIDCCVEAETCPQLHRAPLQKREN